MASRAIDPNAIGSTVPPFGGSTGGSGPVPPAETVVRDAHVIVVGQSGYLAPLAAVPIPPMVASLLDLDAGTGDQLGITCDYLDPGDGSQLALALAAATAAGIPIDIRLRPCDITLSAAVASTTGLAVPAGCRLIGAGREISSLTGATAAGATQTVVALGANAALEDVAVVSPAPAGAPGGAQRGVITGAAGARVVGCLVTLARSTTVDRVQVVGIALPTPAGTEVVRDLIMLIDELASQTTPAESVAIEVGTSTSRSLTSNDLIVEDVQIARQSVGAAGSCPSGVSLLNCEGGIVRDVSHFEAHRPPSTGAFRSWWSFDGGTTTAAVRGPRFIDCTLETTDDEGTAAQIGFALIVQIASATPQLTGGLWNTMFRGCTVRFAIPAVPPATIVRTGFAIRCLMQDGQATVVRDSGLEQCACTGHHRGINIDVVVGGAGGAIESVDVIGCKVSSPRAGGLVAPNGIVLRGGSPAASYIRRVRIVGGDYSGINTALGIGIEIEDAQVFDTVVTSNNATPSGAGTAIVDAGTNSQVGLNVIV